MACLQGFFGGPGLLVSANRSLFTGLRVFITQFLFSAWPKREGLKLLTHHIWLFCFQVNCFLHVNRILNQLKYIFSFIEQLLLLCLVRYSLKQLYSIQEILVCSEFSGPNSHTWSLTPIGPNSVPLPGSCSANPPDFKPGN